MTGGLNGPGLAFVSDATIDGAIFVIWVSCKSHASMAQVLLAASFSSQQHLTLWYLLRCDASGAFDAFNLCELPRQLTDSGASATRIAKAPHVPGVLRDETLVTQVSAIQQNLSDVNASKIYFASHVCGRITQHHHLRLVAFSAASIVCGSVGQANCTSFDAHLGVLLK